MDRKEDEMRQLQYAIYKGKGGKFGVLQFKPQEAHYYCPDCRKKHFKIEPCECGSTKKLDTREGCIFLEVANTLDKDNYDYDHKTVMSLSVTDMAEILTVLEGQKPEVKLLHDPKAKSPDAGKVTKNLHVSSPKGITEGCLFSIVYVNEEQTTKYMVPVNTAETKTLAVLIRSQIPLALNWI